MHATSMYLFIIIVHMFLVGEPYVFTWHAVSFHFQTVRFARCNFGKFYSYHINKSKKTFNKCWKFFNLLQTTKYKASTNKDPNPRVLRQNSYRLSEKNWVQNPKQRKFSLKLKILLRIPKQKKYKIKKKNESEYYCHQRGNLSSVYYILKTCRFRGS